MFQAMRFAAICGVMVVLPSMAMADAAVNAKLLKSWFRNDDPVVSLPVAGGSDLSLFSTPTVVKCPATSKCAIEVEIDLGLEGGANGIFGSAAVAVGAAEQLGGSLMTSEASSRQTYHWVYVKRVKPGSYPVQVRVIADQNMAIDMYSVAIRLYRIP